MCHFSVILELMKRAASTFIKNFLILPGSALNINGESCSPEVNEKLTP